MNRIIPLLSLVALIGGMAYAYYSGLFGQVFDPKVRVLVAKQNLVVDQPLRGPYFGFEEVSMSSVKPGYVIYPPQTKTSDLLPVFHTQIMAEAIKKGDVLTTSHVRERNNLYVLRVMQPVKEGQVLDRSNTMIVPQNGNVPNGSITFSNHQEGFKKYIDPQILTASRDIDGSEPVRIDDVAGETGAVFVMTSRGDFRAGDLLSLDDVGLTARTTTDIPRGSISFPTREAGEIFISTSGGMTLAKGMKEGEVFVVSSLTKTGGSTLADGEIPRTLSEYLEYRDKFPGLSIFVDDKILVGGKPVEGEYLNLWVETGSTDGPFGVVKIKKLAGDFLTFRVVQTRHTPEGVVEDSKYWAEIGTSASAAIDEARQNGRIAFMLSEGTSVSDFIGNGAVCRDSVCSVSKTLSSDLSMVRTAFDSEGSLIDGGEESAADPLTVLDGVSQEIEQRLIARGYDSFRKIASWEDAALRVTAFNLEISQNLAAYIRQQARNLISNPARSQRDLGLSSDDLND
jgi:hypothetical protein